MISRLARRLRALGLTSFSEYLKVLTESPDCEELAHMINRITTNKTEFFRGRQHFDHISRTALPAWRQAGEAAGKRTIMAWSAACSSGEEPYSLAMTLAEFLEDKPGWRFKILATDLDTAMLTKASQGEYDEKALAPVEPALRQKYFDRIKKRPRGPLPGEAGTQERHNLPQVQSDEPKLPLQGSAGSYTVPQCAHLL